MKLRDIFIGGILSFQAFTPMGDSLADDGNPLSDNKIEQCNDIIGACSISVSSNGKQFTKTTIEAISCKACEETLETEVEKLGQNIEDQSANLSEVEKLELFTQRVLAVATSPKGGVGVMHFGRATTEVSLENGAFKQSRFKYCKLRINNMSLPDAQKFNLLQGCP